MNQFGDEHKLTLAEYYPPGMNEILARIADESRLIVLGITFWRCGRPWSVPERKISDNFFLIVHSGAVRVTVEDREKILRRGEAMIVPEFVRHSFGLADDCDAESHFIAHALPGNLAAGNPFTGFDSPFPVIRAPEELLDRLTRIVVLRNVSRELAGLQMRSVFCDLMQQEALAGRYHVESSRKLDERIERAVEYIHQNFRGAISIADIAEKANLKQVRFRTLFTAETGIAPAAYLKRVRLIEAARLLTRSNNKIEEIARLSGFSSAAYLCSSFTRFFHRTPAKFRENMHS